MASSGRIQQVWSPVKSMLRRIGLLHTLRRRAAEIRTYLRVAAGVSNMPATKFVIFAQGRTGSDLLASLLNSHPEIFCDVEILLHKVLFPKALIEGRCAASSAEVYGYKLKIYQLTRTQGVRDPKQFITDSYEQGWRILYLRRDNILRQVISGFVAQHRGAFHHRSTDGPLALGRISIDCHELLLRMKERHNYVAKEKEVLADVPHITVVYEDDLLKAQNHQRTLDMIFDYLGVRSVQVKTELVKITPQRLSDFICNYEEVARVVGNSEHARFLTDGADNRVTG